ncbi:MAG: hypothetical protein HON42_03755 [Alphaproteobacteria bacterium]|jgi:hypothetical protein|nr:hypothetical protein [Alphaproteobacteria bacterium]MBT5827410.1 hypothetical protein [Alphaproteobacteria bacterium]
MLNLGFLEKKQKKFEELKDRIKLENQAAKTLQVNLAKVTSSNDTKAIKELKTQAEEKYEAIRKIRQEAKREIEDLKLELKSSDTKDQLSKISESLDNIEFSRSQYNRDTIQTKLHKFKGESASAAKLKAKAESKEKLESELRRSAYVGVFFGSVYLTIDLLLTKSLEPLFSKEKDIPVPTVTTTPTEDSMTPIDHSTLDNSSITIEEGNGDLPSFNTNPDSSQDPDPSQAPDSSLEPDTGATQIITEEVETEIVVNQLLFTIATVATAISVAIIAAKIIYILTKYITEKPIKEKAELGEHTKTILNYAEKTEASTKMDNVIAYIEEAKKIVAVQAPGAEAAAPELGAAAAPAGVGGLGGGPGG